MQTRSLTSLAPADHTTVKTHKASNIDSKSTNADSKSTNETPSTDKSLLDKSVNVNGNGNDDGKNNDSTPIDTASKEQATGSTKYEKAYTDFLSYASSNLPIIPDPSTATTATMSEAMNKLYALMQTSLQQSSNNLVEITGRFQTLEGKVDLVRERQNEFEQEILHKHKELESHVTKHSQQIGSLESNTVKRSEYEALKTELKDLREEMNDRFQLVADDMINIRLDNYRNATDTKN